MDWQIHLLCDWKILQKEPSTTIECHGNTNKVYYKNQDNFPLPKIISQLSHKHLNISINLVY